MLLRILPMLAFLPLVLFADPSAHVLDTRGTASIGHELSADDLLAHSIAANEFARDEERRHELAAIGLTLGTRKYDTVLTADGVGWCFQNTTPFPGVDQYDCNAGATECNMDIWQFDNTFTFDPWPPVDCGSSLKATWYHTGWPTQSTVYVTD